MVTKKSKNLIDLDPRADTKTLGSSEVKMELYSIGELANLAGVRVKTIRHYEKMDVLFPVYDPDNGCRKYGKEDINRLESILALKLLGFGLSQIENRGIPIKVCRDNMP